MKTQIHDGASQIKEFEASLSQALLEVEQDLSLPSNSLEAGTPLPMIEEVMRLKGLKVLVDPNVLARVPENLLRHSKELTLRKKVAEEKKKNALLMNALVSLLEQ